MAPDRPGPGEQYCPNCRAVISTKAAMCPECNTFDLDGGGGRRDPAGGSPARDRGDAGSRREEGRHDPASRSGRDDRRSSTGGSPGGRRRESAGRHPEGEGEAAASGSAGAVPEPLEGLGRGTAYGAAGAVGVTLSVVTFVGALLTSFSLLVGLFVLPLSALFGIAGTTLGYYSLLRYRSALGGGVALLGTLEAAVVSGTLVVAILVVLGVVALSSPRTVVLLAHLFEWIHDLLFGATVALAAYSGSWIYSSSWI